MYLHLALLLALLYQLMLLVRRKDISHYICNYAFLSSLSGVGYDRCKHPKSMQEVEESLDQDVLLI
jgi:hypothetical protein